eukprot:2568760-Amphidinium_carterae.1
MEPARTRRCATCARHGRRGRNCQHCLRWTCLGCATVSQTRNGADSTCRGCALVDLTGDTSSAMETEESGEELQRGQVQDGEKKGSTRARNT